MVVSIPDPTGPGSDSHHPYPVAVAFALLSILIALLITPTLFQHYRNHNIGATALVAGVIITSIFNFVNAIIWANDNMGTWFNGVGLCDVEVKWSVFGQTLFPSSLVCILRALAGVMNTDSAAWMQTQAQKRRNYAIDIVCCVVAPSIQMILHYIVQPNRYIIFGIAGCTSTTDGSWLAFVLMVLPPLLWILVDVYFAVVIMIRLVRYRLTFNSILANSSTTKSRFIRLYMLCLVSILLLVPLEVFALVRNRMSDLLPYSWNGTHHPTDRIWGSALLIRSNGTILYDRYIWLIGGFVIFAFFGFGKDAVRQYKAGLLAMGMGRIFPSLYPQSQRKASLGGTITSLGSKAKLYFKRKESNATWSSSTSTACPSTPSPKKMTFMESIKEDSRSRPALHINTPPQQKKAGPFFSLTSMFNKKQHKPSYSDDPFILTNVSSPTRHFDTSVSAEPPSPTTCSHMRSHSRSEGDVFVRREIRQASETAETLPTKMYEGV